MEIKDGSANIRCPRNPMALDNWQGTILAYVWLIGVSISTRRLLFELRMAKCC